MGNLNILTFAISRVEIAPYNNGAAVTTWTNIPLAAESSVEHNVQTNEVKNEVGVVTHVSHHSPHVSVVLRMRRFGFRLLEMITGSPVSSSSGAESIYGGRDEEVIASYVRLRLQCRGVNEDGGTHTVRVVVFKARGYMPTFPIREVTMGEYAVSFSAAISSVDENGSSIPPAFYRVGVTS